MSDMKNAVQQVKQAFDKIEQAKSNPQALQQAIADAKHKVDELAKHADQD